MENLGIHSAACSGDIESLINLISSNKTKLVNEVNHFGMTPLHGAAFHGQLEAARILLESGANPNHPSSGPKYTFPIHLAVSRLNEELVELLLVEGGADPSLKDYLGHTILDVAQGISVENDSVATDPDTNIKMMNFIKECIVKAASSTTTQSKPHKNQHMKTFSYESRHQKRRDEVGLNDCLSDFGDYNNDRIDQELRDSLMYHVFKSGIL